jgi:hypothetical protein
LRREDEAAALDARILTAIERYELGDAAFDALALDLFRHQARYNAPYAAFARSRGVDAEHPPARWHEIPAVPTSAFKEAVLTTFDPARAMLRFQTSGTTAAEAGCHLLETHRLYDAALLAAFDRFILDDGARLRYLLLVPRRESSSLGYMMQRVAHQRGDGREGWYLRDDDLDLDDLLSDVSRAYDDGVAVCLAGTAFAFVALIDELARRGIVLETRSGSRIMETGGFKGRSRSVERAELYRDLSGCTGIPVERIVAEYGMTELSSQYYDAPRSRTNGERVKAGPPWLRPRIVGADGREVAPGEVGVLRHYDLANRGSVIGIETDDVALRLDGDAFVLLGRDPDARLRGCSLDAEDLIARRY